MLFILFSIEEVWVGASYSHTDGNWTWENGVAATEQNYFRRRQLTNVTANADVNVCAKAVIKRRRGVRKLFIHQEECSRSLPIICQYSKHFTQTRI